MTLATTTVTSFGQCFTTDYHADPNSGQITIKEKVLVPGKTKADLFDLAAVWVAINMTEAQESGQKILNDTRLTVSNKDLGILKGTFRINYSYKEGFRYLLYDITIRVGEGYYEYTINGFSMNKKPMEEFLRTKYGDEFYAISFADICKKLKSAIVDMKTNIQ